MWQEWWKRWIEMAYWWLPRQEEPPATDRRGEPARGPGPREAAPPSEPAAPEPPRAEQPAAAPPPPQPPAAEPPAPEPARAAAPDDLTTIKGIGPATQDRLRALGIVTFGDLAAADPEAVAERLKGAQPISAQLVRSWTEDARARTGN